MNESLMNSRAQSQNAYLGDVAQTEADRAIPQAMTQLAETVGALETAARALAGRISRLIPGGSPFERSEKLASMQQTAQPGGAPVAVRSHHCDELHTRIYELCEITARIKEMVKGVEV